MFILAACFAGLGVIAVLLVRRNPDFTAEVTVIDESQLTVKEALCHR